MKATTLVFLDWDDTLFPTTACSNDGLIAVGGLRGWRRDQIKANIDVAKYKDIGLLVYYTLSNYILCYGASNVNIVTNGGHQWPQISLRHLSLVIKDNIYMDILTLLKTYNITIVSAQYQWAKYYPFMPNIWKYNAFKYNILSKYLDNIYLSENGYIKFITIGDRDIDHSSITKCINDTEFQAKIKKYNVYITHKKYKLMEQTSVIQFHKQILQLAKQLPTNEYFTKKYINFINGSKSSINDKSYFTQHFVK